MNAAQRAIFLEVSTVNISGVRGLRNSVEQEYCENTRDSFGRSG
jgi:hypothetical protein